MPVHGPHDHGLAGVSIHARHYWRAMLPNPRRALHGCVVSIHARHYWRAMRDEDLRRGAAEHVSIHARHYWRAMPVVNISFSLVRWFQSTPAITGGRCWNDGDWAGIRNRFNPRPPLLAGDAPLGTRDTRGM